MKFEGFIGGSYQSASANADAERAVNLLVESIESGQGKGKAYLKGRPGLALWTTLPTTPVRGLVAGEDRLFAASDSRLYEVDAGGTCTELGVIQTDSNKTPVQMFLNGTQLFVVSAQCAYIHNGVSLARCIDGGTPSKSGIASAAVAAEGTVNTAGTAVTWASGSTFSATIHSAGKWIYITGVPYVISVYTDATHLTLSTTAGTQTGAAYYSGSRLTSVSGDAFDAVTHAAGEFITVAGLSYEVGLYEDASHIVLKAFCGTFSGAAWESQVLTPTSSGTVNTSGTAVTWASGTGFNSTTHAAGNQIVIAGVTYTIVTYTDSTHLVLYTSAGSQTGAAYKTWPVLAAVTGAYLGGYFLAQQPKTTPAPATDGRVIRISGLYDGSSWDSLDFLTKEARPDSIRSIMVDHLELYILGRRSIEVWRNDGDSLNAFTRDPGGFVDMGSAMAFVPTVLGGSLYFLSADDRGQITAQRLRGFQPTRVSTHAVEALWSQYVRNGWGITDGSAYGYTEDGHDFWVISFPNADRTWVYDATSGLWHEWAWFDGSSFRRHRGRCHAFVFDRHLLGDWENGKIYWSSFGSYNDADASIRYQRIAPHLANEEERIFYQSLQLDMDTGTASGAGTVNTSGTAATWVSGDKFDAVCQAAGKTIVITGVEYTIATYTDSTHVTLTGSAGTQTGVAYSVEPPMVLDWSENDGRTWSGQKSAGAGKASEDTKRVIWRRLGAGRDRIFRVTVDAKARQAWTNAIFKLTKGDK